jgi:AAA family ATP:ADP antiporter
MGEAAKHLGTANMLLVSAVLMEGGLFCFRRLDPPNRTSFPANEATQRSSNPFAGFIQVVRSPYLCTILFYTFATTLCSTCLYTRQAEMFKAVWPDSADRAGIFARMDFWTLVITGALQMLLATVLIKRSVGLALCMLPLVFAVGFGALSATSSIWVLMGTVVLSRACTYGLSVPAIGVLYTVVSRDDKYKAKNIIDTLVIRGGDAFTTWSVSGLRATGMAIPILTGLMVPIAFTCMGLGLLLGRRNAQAKSVEV